MNAEQTTVLEEALRIVMQAGRESGWQHTRPELRRILETWSSRADEAAIGVVRDAVGRRGYFAQPEKVRTIRKPSVLERAADDVAYEIETLIIAAEQTGEIIHSSPMSGELRIPLEAFLLHFRNLVEFLCPDTHALHQQTVIASDFLDREKPENLGRKDVLWRDKSRINALLAHISYGRARYKDRNQMAWRVKRMRREVVEDLQKFIGKLPDERRAWFLRREGVREAVSGNVARVVGSIADTCTSTMVTTTIVDIGGRATEPSSASTQDTCKPPSETR